MQESRLHEHVYRHNAALPARVTIPPGDDLAGLTFGDASVLVGVDQLVAGVHYDPARTDPAAAGRKAVNRNLSDVAAMAAYPLATLAAVALPPGTPDREAEALLAGLREAAADGGAPVVGGDIAALPAAGPLVVSVTVLAEPAGIAPITRRGAQTGDDLWVSGSLGHSFVSGHHLTFNPRVRLARILAADPAIRPRAMMDLSDGLARDLPRLTPHAEIDADRLPIRAAGVATAALTRPAWEAAVDDGEDYELLMVYPPDRRPPPTVDGVSLTRIGRVTAAGGVRLGDAAGRWHDLAGRGWDHDAGGSAS